MAVNVVIVLRLYGDPFRMQPGVVQRGVVFFSERLVRGPETAQDEERSWAGFGTDPHGAAVLGVAVFYSPTRGWVYLRVRSQPMINQLP